MKEKKKLVIVGNGMATGRLLDDLSQYDAFGETESHVEITVIGDEPVGGYNRILLSPVLAGEASPDSIVTKPVSWYCDNSVILKIGASVDRIDRDNKKVCLAGGETCDYDILVLAIGSRPSVIPAANQNLLGVTVFRTLADVDYIQTFIASTQQGEQRAVVVGGGFLGLEAAYGIACQGVKVTLIHRSAWLLNRQLDKASGALLERVMAEKNIDFRLNDEVDTFLGEQQLQGVRLKSGEILPCSLTVIAAGITPNKELGQAAGLACNRGIEVNGFLQTSDADIFALGECVEFEGETFGLVEPIWRQSQALASYLMSVNSSPFVSDMVATKLKVSGVSLFSAGEHITREGMRELVYQDVSNNIYRKLLLKDNKIVGIVLFGDIQNGQNYYDMMINQAHIAGEVDMLVLSGGFYDFAA